MKKPVFMSILLASLPAFSLAVESAVPVAAATLENRPPKLVREKQAVFPMKLLKNGVTNGAARIALAYTSDGKLVDSMAVAYTHREFADEALDVAKKWRYEPAIIKGQPVGLVVDVSFRFEVDGILVIDRVMPPLIEEQSMGNEFVYKPCPIKKLDTIPLPKQVASPVYPEEWLKQGITGKVVVEFFIDETGKTRMPATIASSNDLLSAISVMAVEGWRFEPPTQRGKPTLVRAQQIFTYGVDAPKP